MNGVRRDTCRGDTAKPAYLQRACLLLLVGVVALYGTGLVWAAEPSRLPPAPPSQSPTPPPRGLRSADDLSAIPSEVEDPFHEDRASETPTEVLAAVVIEGNQTITSDEISKHIKTRSGRPTNAKLIKEDIRELYKTKWFLTVEHSFRHSDRGLELVFTVSERPILESVVYRGNKKIKEKELAGLTGLRAGGAFDVASNREAARRLERHYREKGFLFATVKLEKGGSKQDRVVVFEIDEGSKVHITKQSFEGNKAISDAMLKTKTRSKPRKFFFFGGKYDPAETPEDIAALKTYYHSLGYFDIQIEAKPEFSDDKSKVDMHYVIDEGVRYKIRKIEIKGNKVLSEAALRQDMQIKANDYFTERRLVADVEKITNQYGELGRIFAKIDAVPRYLEEPGTVDLVYNIDEDRPWRIRRINVHTSGTHPHTKESVAINRLPFKPGDLANSAMIKKGEQKLSGTQIYGRGGPSGGEAPRITVTRVDPEQQADSINLVRMQTLDDDVPNTATTRNSTYPQNTAVAQNTAFSQNTAVAQAAPLPPVIQDPNGDMFNQSLTAPPPNWVEPPPGQLDADVYVSEAQTGRLMFGVGVNSNAGLVGSVVLDENNFDLTRPPRSFQEILDGTAFRGGGQQLRMEAVPGTQLSRYLISWRDPYFMDQDVSLGVSGSYFTRIFPNWLEKRLGGRITGGKQWTQEFSTNVAIRLEDVTISDPTFPTPTPLADVVGTNFLSTARVSAIHDTRDTPFIASTGHYVELSYEQAFGNYVYPRVDLDGRQYFKLRERPDGTGKHILSLSGQLGWTGSDTPLFERYFAGGFHSFRGFQFYGVTPRELDVRVGGNWQALGSVEYMVPVTADDAVQIVTFTDFGTVTQDVGLQDFRLSVGAGLRLTIPMMGPVPIALDWAVPIMREDFDTRQLFSFYIGMAR